MADLCVTRRSHLHSPPPGGLAFRSGCVVCWSEYQLCFWKIHHWKSLKAKRFFQFVCINSTFTSGARSGWRSNTMLMFCNLTILGSASVLWLKLLPVTLFFNLWFLSCCGWCGKHRVLSVSLEQCGRWPRANKRIWIVKLPKQCDQIFESLITCAGI